MLAYTVAGSEAVFWLMVIALVVVIVSGLMFILGRR